MHGPELVDSRSRFRFIESCLGLMGCLCICYAICTPQWLDGSGLWSSGNETTPDNSGSTNDIAKGVWCVCFYRIPLGMKEIHKCHSIYIYIYLFLGIFYLALGKKWIMTVTSAPLKPYVHEASEALWSKCSWGTEIFL